MLRIDSGYPPGEYLLIENKRKYGFDTMVPQAGLAIWHIDETKGKLSTFGVNLNEGFPGQPGWPTNDKHYRVALLQADGLYDLEELSGHVAELKLKHPDHDGASVLLEPQIEYDHLIQVMDAVRSAEMPVEGQPESQLVALFTDIAIGDAP